MVKEIGAPQGSSDRAHGKKNRSFTFQPDWHMAAESKKKAGQFGGKGRRGRGKEGQRGTKRVDQRGLPTSQLLMDIAISFGFIETSALNAHHFLESIDSLSEASLRTGRQLILQW